MKLAGRSATFFLSEEGKDFFARVGGPVLGGEGKGIYTVTSQQPPGAVTLDVMETDETGIWVQIQRESRARALLLRWEFILGIELPVDTGKVVGMKG